jgi:hypothetical protein
MNEGSILPTETTVSNSQQTMGMITPAISVLSAIEGLRIITPAFNPFLQFFYRLRTPTIE